MTVIDIKRELGKGYVDNDMLIILNEKLPNGLLPQFSLDEQTAESFNTRNLIRYIDSELGHNLPLSTEEKETLIKNKDIVLELAEAMTNLSFSLPTRTRNITTDDVEVTVDTIKDPLVKELEVEEALLNHLSLEDSTVEDFVKWANDNPYMKVKNEVYKEDAITDGIVSHETHKMVELLEDLDNTKTVLSFINKLHEELPANLLSQQFGV